MICGNIGINKNGNLTFAGQDTVELAEKYSTPLYLIDENKVREKMRIYVEAINKYFPSGSMPLYASKALCFKKIYKIASEENMGIDVVSSVSYTHLDVYKRQGLWSKTAPHRA